MDEENKKKKKKNTYKNSLLKERYLLVDLINTEAKLRIMVFP